jgi:alpha-L-fucosidase
MEFKKLKDAAFANNLLKDAKAYWEINEEAFLKDSVSYRTFNKKEAAFGINSQSFLVQLSNPQPVNCIVLREAIHLGQSIENFRIILLNNNIQVGEINGTTIGRKRIVSFPAQTITSFRVILRDRFGNDNVSGVAAYLIDEKLVEK